MKILISVFLNGLALWLSGLILGGIDIDNLWVAILAGIVLSLANLIIKPIVIFFTLPITLLTLGLFLWVINAMMILLADWLVPGFYVDGFWWALVLSFLLALMNYLFEKLKLK